MICPRQSMKGDDIISLFAKNMFVPRIVRNSMHDLSQVQANPGHEMPSFCFVHSSASMSHCDQETPSLRYFW